MKHNIKWFLIVLLLASEAYSQTPFFIYGTVSDTTLKPLQDGLVLLFKQKDSTLVKNTFITDGKFSFEGVDSGNYIIRTNCLGYKDEAIHVLFPIQNKITFILHNNGKSLKELQVTGYRKSFDFKNGNIISTIENTVLATLPDVIEVLSKLPTVQVSNDRESVNVIGKGTPIIYLDNQRISLNDLSVLSVSDIKSIEVINNPSSRYEADGMAVILVKRKFNPQNGYRVDFSEVASQKRFFENRAGINASIKRSKLEVKLNLQYNYINRWEGLEGTIITDTGFYQSGFGGTSKGPRKQYLFGAGVFYQINNTDYFSVNVNMRMQDEPFIAKTASTEKDISGKNVIDNKAYGLSKRPYINFTLNYLKEFSKIKSQLFFGAQLAHYERNLENDISNNINSAGFLNTEKRQQQSGVDIGVARVDFDKKIGKEQKWSSGILITRAHANTQFDIDYLQMPTSINTTYLYTENNQAAYTQLAGNVKKVTYQAGVRIETTDLKGGYMDSAALLINRNFYNFFPKATATLPIDSFSNVTLNYVRSIRRPDYANANQVTNYITPFLEFSNNINISPSITDEVSVNYHYKKVMLTISLYTRTNPAYHITQRDSFLNKLRIINVNLAAENGGVLTFNLPFEYKRFSSTNIVSAIYNRVNDDRANFVEALPYYYFYSNNQFKLPKNYTFVLAGWLSTKRNEGIFERNGQFAVDLSLSKVIRKKFTITLNAFDIFRSLNYIESYNVNNIYAKTTYYENVREFSIALKYWFGKIQNQQYKNREVNEGSRIN